MIAAYMIAYHDAATDYDRLALKSNVTSSLRREHLNQAGKLSRTDRSGAGGAKGRG
jgi:hypothetical protein